MKPFKKKSRPDRQQSLTDAVAGSDPPAAEDIIARLGLKWTGVAAVLAVIFFFWTWLFLDHAGRSSVVMLVFSPDLWIGQWFGIVGDQRLPVSFTDRLPIVFTALFILVASFGPGSLLVGLLTRKVAEQDRVEHVVLALGAGLNLSSLFVLAGGMSMRGALHDLWWIWLGLLVGLLTLPLAIWRFLRRSEDGETNAEQAHAAKPDFGVRIAPFLIGVLSLPYLFGAMVPPWDFDVREYHLQAPKEWMQRGQIEFMPHNVYANMPLGAELHAITATAILGNGEEAWWLGGMTAKLLISLFAPLTALLLWRIGVQARYATAGVVAALIYLTLPWVAHVSLGGLNDAVLGFYLLATWWVWLRSEQGSWRALVLAGYFAGAAAAVKYPALIFLVLPLFVETLVRRLGLRGPTREPTVGLAKFKQAFIAMVLLAAGLALGGVLWYAKNAIQSGNPVYPLLASRLGGLTRTPQKDARWVQAHAVPQDEQGRRFSATPLWNAAREFSFGRRDVDGNYHGENASPLLIPLAVFGAWFAIFTWWRKHGAERAGVRFPLICLGASAFLFAAWFLITHRLERFLVPAMPLLALLAGFGYVYAKEQAGSTVTRLFLCVGLLYSFLLIAEGGYLQRSLKARPLPLANPYWFVTLPTLREPLSSSHEWIQENLTGDDAILMVGDAAVWDLPGKPNQTTIYYNTCFDDCLLVDWLAGLKTPEEQRLALGERNIQYICVDWREIDRYRSPGNYGYDPRLTTKFVNDLLRARVLKVESLLGADPKVTSRPPQMIYRVLRSAEAAAEEAADRARQKASQPKNAPTPKAAPTKSANQSRTSESR